MLSLVMLLCGFILLGLVALAIYIPIFSLEQTVNGLDYSIPSLVVVQGNIPGMTFLTQGHDRTGSLYHIPYPS